jgi:acyl dehydratase
LHHLRPRRTCLIRRSTMAKRFPYGLNGTRQIRLFPSEPVCKKPFSNGWTVVLAVAGRGARWPSPFLAGRTTFVTSYKLQPNAWWLERNRADGPASRRRSLQSP